MTKKPQRKITWAMLLILAGVVLLLKSKVEPAGSDINIPLTIDVTEAFQSPENEASDMLTVGEYKTNAADQSQRTIKAEYTYSPNGQLQEYTEYVEYTAIEEGLLGMKACSGSRTWSVSSEGTRTGLYSSGYKRNKNKEIVRETTNTADGQKIITEYSLRTDGQTSVASLYIKGDGNVSKLVSTKTYQYSQSGTLISSSLTYAGDSANDTKTTYVSNTNGKPVRITTRDYSDAILSVEKRGYDEYGNLRYSIICDKNDNVVGKTWYYYDEEGYLEKSVDLELNTAGELAVSSIKTYEYFDW